MNEYCANAAAGCACACSRCMPDINAELTALRARCADQERASLRVQLEEAQRTPSSAMDGLRDEIEALQMERNRLQIDVESLVEVNENLYVELATIRAKTIEECAKVAQSTGVEIPANEPPRIKIARKIRALSSPRVVLMAYCSHSSDEYCPACSGTGIAKKEG